MASKQFAALPFRLNGATLDILLITTRRKRRWSVPKGWPLHENPRLTAEIEAFEEAGLIGRASAKSIGRFKHRKDKGKRKIACTVSVYPLLVRAQERRWPEYGERDMIWLPASEAADLVHKPQLRRLIAKWARNVRHGSVKPIGKDR
jgi:8-oxo-dGTP pyrophosphatase MutT (NUDIX family)